MSPRLETRTTRLETRKTRLETRYSKFSSFEDRGSSRVVRVSSDCQLTFDRYCTSDTQFIEEVEAFASSTVDQLPATAQRLQEIIEAHRDTMKYACKSEGIAKWVGQHTCPINPYSGHIGKAELT